MWQSGDAFDTQAGFAECFHRPCCPLCLGLRYLKCLDYFLRSCAPQLSRSGFFFCFSNDKNEV